MTALPHLVAFDLDDTLAPSKAPLPEPVVTALSALLGRTLVAVISGANVSQFETQLVAQLGSVPETDLERLFLLPTCGTRFERFSGGSWHTVYDERLTPVERDAAFTAVREEAVRLGLWENSPWGEILEDRGSQVTFSALGQQAPLDAKHAWDPSGAKKNMLRAAVAARLPNLEVRSGGSTSVDITRKGIDKAYGMRKLSAQTGVSLDDMLFVGDRLDPDGNDYPVRAMGVQCRAVAHWSETVRLVEELVEL